MKVLMPINMPKTVKDALANIWTGIPANINNICYTYGDTLYTTKEESELERHLLRHEKTHTHQQGEDPDAWWRMYGKSPKFRYEQELEAYRVQYRYFREVNGKVKAFEFAKYLANEMASPMYGGMCTAPQALQGILRP